MDYTPQIIGFVGVVVVAVVGFVGVLAGRGSKPSAKSWNGNERRDLTAAINEHVICCPNTIKLEKAMNHGFDELKREIHDLGQLLETHRNLAHK